ncbi:patatin-like phospholipase domain-containing protein 4 [Saccoglossus kowalevskii]|uniref:Patatin-like phospholipase domain-containing protein 4-like n=1 Tax=Saccoglossus kowalevskii TaxID=10224 RepID=A0ABM0GRQ4_SACKO|nr:PREDICTED: patatin-like phospholipase domain-containing protein 4-like [Saccoglossus kowalevskii]
MSGPDTFNVVFSGTSFLGIYNIGSAQCLLDHAKNVLKKVQCYGGTSVGAIVAAMMLTSPEKLLVLMDDIFKLTQEIQSHPQGALTVGFDLTASLRTILDRELRSDAHQLCTDRLQLLIAELVPTVRPVEYKPPSVEETVHPRSQVQKPKVFEVREQFWTLGNPTIITKFESREELIEAILASSYIPWFENWTPPQINGKFWADGTLVTSRPIEEFKFSPGRLITIAPNKQATHQRPQDNITPFWRDVSRENFDMKPYNMFRVGDALYPPKKPQLEKYYMDGLQDAKEFLQKYRFFEHNQDTFTIGGAIY